MNPLRTMRMMRVKLLSFIGWILISLWSRSVRVTFVNREVPERLTAEGRNFVYAFWHGRQFLLFHHHRKKGIIIPASESRDGEIQARILSRFGFDVVRGSSKRKGDRALLGLVDGLRKGKQVALAVDGPRGPIHEVKQGVIYLAGKLDKLIIPVSTSAKRFWILKRIWDKYLLPMPFTKGVIVYGDPVAVSGISEDELESKQRELKEALNRVTKEADEHFRNR
jgi:lysophospholipid acyltransferase (LPLAT)-like uncharacterized protein